MWLWLYPNDRNDCILIRRSIPWWVPNKMEFLGGGLDGGSASWRGQGFDLKGHSFILSPSPPLTTMRWATLFSLTFFHHVDLIPAQETMEKAVHWLNPLKSWAKTSPHPPEQLVRISSLWWKVGLYAIPLESFDSDERYFPGAGRWRNLIGGHGISQWLLVYRKRTFFLKCVCPLH